MSFLDELRQAADEKHRREVAEQEDHVRREAYYRDIMRPKLEFIYSFLAELAEHLNYVGREITADYQLEGYGELEGLRQGNYAVSADSRRDMKNVALSFECRGEGMVRLPMVGKHAIRRYNEYLLNNHLTFDNQIDRGGSRLEMTSTFLIENRVPVDFIFLGDVDHSRIQLTVRNFDRLGARVLSLAPESVDEAMMDRLARYVVRDDDSFLQLDITEDQRRKIREQVEAEQRQRELESRMAEMADRVESEPQNLRSSLSKWLERFRRR